MSRDVGVPLWRLALPFVVVGSLSLGCATAGVPLEELSEEPIAFVYWDASDARRRAEILERMEPGASAPVRRGVARVESMRDYLGFDDGRRSPSRLRDYPGHVVLLNPRTLEITPLAVAPANARPLAWSRDHRRLLFSSQHLDAGTTQLYEYDRDTGEVRKLTRGPIFHIEGDYGPDGRLVISWIRLEDGRAYAGLLLADSGGGSVEPILRGEYPSGVRWSPKGDVLLYVEADNRQGLRESQRDISSVVVRPLAKGAEKDVLARGRDAVFSPDGSWVVFTSQTSKGWNLHRIRPDGSARSPVGGGVRDERSPTVSPDGRHVVYVSEDGEISRLYLRRMDGSGDRILLGEGAASSPVW